MHTGAGGEIEYDNEIRWNFNNRSTTKRIYGTACDAGDCITRSCGIPGMSVQFDVGRKKSILAVNQAMDINQTVFLVAQKDLETSDPKQEHLHKVGVIAKSNKYSATQKMDFVYL